MLSQDCSIQPLVVHTLQPTDPQRRLAVANSAYCAALTAAGTGQLKHVLVQ